ncbi:MAG: hypothetical protein ABIU05_05800, partial [Nitrospirales bacterium]
LACILVASNEGPALSEPGLVLRNHTMRRLARARRLPVRRSYSHSVFESSSYSAAGSEAGLRGKALVVSRTPTVGPID